MIFNAYIQTSKASDSFWGQLTLLYLFCFAYYILAASIKRHTSFDSREHQVSVFVSTKVQRVNRKVIKSTEDIEAKVILTHGSLSPQTCIKTGCRE